jgi:hypothetical protein
MPSNIQKKTATSARKNAGSPISNNGFTTVNRSRTNATNDNDQIDQSGHTRGGSTYGPHTPSAANKQTTLLPSMDPEDKLPTTSIQEHHHTNDNNATEPVSTNASPYKEALKTPVQPIQIRSLPVISSASRNAFKDMKDETATSFATLTKIITYQNSMITQSIHSSSDRNVDALMTMTERIVSAFQETTKLTTALQVKKDTTTNNSEQEDTKEKQEEVIEILSDEPDSYDEDYKIGYENYLKTLKNNKTVHKKRTFRGKPDENQKNISNLDKTSNNDSSIQYIENVQQKQKEKQQKQHFQHEPQQQQSLAPKIHSPSSANENKLFVNNLFNTATAGTVKFKDISAGLSRISLKDDSNLEMKEFYDLIILSISYGYSYDISHLPSADQLHTNIDFKQYFTDGIDHNEATLCRMEAMYNRIGRLFRTRLLSKECISPEKCPEAAKIISNNTNLNGWKLLTVLLKVRLVMLGAKPKSDLDYERVSMQLIPGETYHELYECCNHLSQEYISQCQHIYLCPRIKLLQKFISDLMRSSIYIPYLLNYEMKLIEHIEEYGDSDYSVPLPFTMKQVYDYLQRRDIQDIPQELRKARSKSCPSTPNISTSNYSLSTPTSVPNTTTQYTPLLANCEHQIEEHDEIFEMTDPEICAFVRNNKEVCVNAACLVLIQLKV